MQKGITNHILLLTHYQAHTVRYNIITADNEEHLASRGSQRMGNNYSPRDLDGWLIAGRHRTFLPFSSYVVREFFLFDCG